MQLSSQIIWSHNKATRVEVRSSVCTYNVVIAGTDAHVTAPGINQFVDLDADVYPVDEPEAVALVIVAQVEGGIEL